jgi:hypothetical protein
MTKPVSIHHDSISPLNHRISKQLSVVKKNSKMRFQENFDIVIALHNRNSKESLISYGSGLAKRYPRLVMEWLFWQRLVIVPFHAVRAESNSIPVPSRLF